MSSIEATTFVLAVRDLKKSTEFYVDVLGFERDPIRVDGWSFLSRGSWHLRLGECPDVAPAGEIGDHSFYAYVHVTDAADLYGEVKSRGAEMIQELADKPWGMREFAVRTPDGHRILFGEAIETPAGS
jgi:catechol 2,3-dioxygenase-like lactoylglutathione lyase family enzyme